ncbi:hypothetical protein A4A49_21697 [Nicotiana attenuata]|uniref:Uncharacterized protein n=1 Tax=Nicotiana attenuata TaxID=49451 RepID=A0A314L509_NICAT|nr:hypothetical protein A4A49_21697 [Nicotiana attenuata]
MGYAIVGGFYYQDSKTKNFVYMDSDAQLLNIVSNLENEDELHLYIQHIVLDPEVVDDVAPTRLIGGPEVVRENVVDESEVKEEVAAETEEREEVAAESEVRENVVDESEVMEDVAAETEVREEVDAETKVREDDVTDLDGAISDLDSSSDSEFDVVPEEDDSDADEELIAVRNEKRTKLKASRRKKPTVHVEGGMGESTQATQQSQGSQATQESTATNRGNGRGRGNSANTSMTSGRGRGNNTSFGRGAFPNAPPPTAPRKLTVGIKRIRGRGAKSAKPSDGHKRSRNVGFGMLHQPYNWNDYH